MAQYVIRYKDKKGKDGVTRSLKFPSYVMKYKVVGDRMISFTFTPHIDKALVYDSSGAANQVIAHLKGKLSGARGLMAEKIV